MWRWLWVAIGWASVCSAQEWQQEVRYTIRAELLPRDTVLRVQTRMVYRNHSPDTLHELYVHLYWNIFAPQSYARQMSRERRLERIPELPPVRVDSFVVIASTGEQRREFDVDNTIVRLALPRPLGPGDSVLVLSSVVQRIPPEGLRMGHAGGDFFIAHWFPSVCVYDRYGWHTEQYLGTGEFYEEIADFDVELTLPGTYVVVHTGTLLNAAEVLPPDVVQNLERARTGTAPVRIADLFSRPLQDTAPRTWRFRAERVRTVAWAAVRRYLWDAQQWDGILVHVLYPKSLESFYRDEGLRAAVHAVRYFSEHFGRYVYSDLFVVVGGTTGGMEYPGIVFIGRGLLGGPMAPVTAEVIMHEIGHNWYPMMLNSNETEFGFQDEGFNTFITTLALEAFYGRWNMGPRVPSWLRPFVSERDERTANAISTILWSLTGWDEPLLTRSDWYRTPAGYSVNSYPKTATLLFMLRGIVGENTFAELMQEYYRRYRFRHVYPEDFAQLAAEVVSRRQGRRTDLRWFFDQWFAQTPVVDYALAGLRNTKAGVESLWDVSVSIERRGSAILPVTVELLLENGERRRVNFSVEEVLRGPARLEKTLRLPSRAVRAVLDPDTVLLLDINRLNNVSGAFPPVRQRFFVEALATDPPELYAYGVSWQPALGFNNQDGLKLGAEVRGAYLGMFHAVRLAVTQGIRLRPHSFNALFQWRHLFWQLPGKPQANAFAAWQDGWWRLRVGATVTMTPEPPTPWELTARLAAAYWQRQTSVYAFPNSPLRSTPYSGERVQLLVTKAVVRATYRAGWGDVRVRGSVEPLWYREPDAVGVWAVVDSLPQFLPPRFARGRSFLWATVELLLEPETPLPLRLRGVLGWFAPEDVPGLFPPLVGFRLSSVSPIEELELPLYRAPGILSPAARQRRIAPTGGGFVRGYVAHDTLGSKLAAVNAELEITPLLRAVPGVRFVTSVLSVGLFADGGQVGTLSVPGLRQWLWDAGVSLSVRLLPRVAGLSPLPLLERLGIDQLTLDLPLFLSHPPASERRWAFRWTLRFRALPNAFVEW